MADVAEPVGQEPTATEAGQNPATGETFDAAYVKTLRAEAAKHRVEAQEAKRKVAEYEQAQLTEAQKLQAQVTAAQDAAKTAQDGLRRAKAEAALAREAAKVGIDFGLLSRLVDIEYDAEGQPVGVAEAVTKVLKDFPQLKAGPEPVALGVTNPSRPAGRLTMADVAKMTPEEVNARWGEVQAAMTAKG